MCNVLQPRVQYFSGTQSRIGRSFVLKIKTLLGNSGALFNAERFNSDRDDRSQALTASQRFQWHFPFDLVVPLHIINKTTFIYDDNKESNFKTYTLMIIIAPATLRTTDKNLASFPNKQQTTYNLNN